MLTRDEAMNQLDDAFYLDQRRLKSAAQDKPKVVEDMGFYTAGTTMVTVAHSALDLLHPFSDFPAEPAVLACAPDRRAAVEALRLLDSQIAALSVRQVSRWSNVFLVADALTRAGFDTQLLVVAVAKEWLSFPRATALRSVKWPVVRLDDGNPHVFGQLVHEGDSWLFVPADGGA